MGAGIGGLAAAIRLARLGLRVTVLERHPTPGGRAGLWEADGFRFDTGPSLVLMVDQWRELFGAAGRRLEDYVTLVRLDPAYRIHYPDGSTLEVAGRLGDLVRNVERIEPGVGPDFLRFLERAGALYEGGLRFVSRPMHTRAAMFGWRSARLLLGSGSLGDLRRLVGRYVRDERLRQALTFQSLYLGLSPYRSLAVYSLLAYAEIAGGVHYPAGGVHALPRALERLGRELGVELRYGAEVTRLERDGGRVAAAVLADGTRVPADLVVVNADLPYAYHALLGEPYPGVERLEFSCSTVLLFLGVRRRYPELLHHNLIVPQGMREACTDIFERRRMPDDPPFYLCARSRTDPTAAPPGCENLVVLVPAPSQDPARPIDWAVEGPRVEALMLERLERFGLTGLRRHLAIRHLFTPADYTAAFGNLRGEAFGLAHGFRQIGYFRPHNRHPRLRNLYFVGQSTHPGCGLPMVLISARLAVDRLAREHAVA